MGGFREGARGGDLAHCTTKAGRKNKSILHLLQCLSNLTSSSPLSNTPPSPFFYPRLHGHVTVWHVHMTRPLSIGSVRFTLICTNIATRVLRLVDVVRRKGGDTVRYGDLVYGTGAFPAMMAARSPTSPVFFFASGCRLI